MIEISSRPAPPGLDRMFGLDRPTGIRALAVLAGGNMGRVFTDDPARPTWGLVWEADDGTLYRGGQVSRSVLAEAVALLRQDSLAAIGFRDGDPDIASFPPDPDAGAVCLEFDRPAGASDLSPYLGRLPDGYTACRMDRPLLERSARLEEHIGRYGSLENFLARGIAVCILHGETLVSEAYADMDVRGVRELGIGTHPAYRKRGFATIACAHLIRLCEEGGSSTYWDCVRLNAGSAAIAQKLGFQNRREYRLLAWFPPRDPQAPIRLNGGSRSGASQG